MADTGRMSMQTQLSECLCQARIQTQSLTGAARHKDCRADGNLLLYSFAAGFLVGMI